MYLLAIDGGRRIFIDAVSDAAAIMIATKFIQTVYVVEKIVAVAKGVQKIERIHTF